MNRVYGVAEQSIYDEEDRLEELSDRLNDFLSHFIGL
jgi:hypothetical protein